MQILDSLIDGPLLLGSRREGDELIGMIVRYLRTGDEPEPRTDAQRAILTAVRPVMKTSHSRIVAGGNGGSKTASNDASKAPSNDASKASSKRPSKTASEAPNKAPSKRPSEEEEEEEVGRGARKRERATRFRAPSPAEVAEYAAGYASTKGVDLGSTDFDPERFVDFYAQKGWRVGTAPMRDWRAAARNWVRTSRPGRREAGNADFSEYD